MYRFRKKRLFDEDADWVPTRGRAFVMKGSAEEASEPDRQDDPKPIKQEDPKPTRQEDPKPNITQSEDSRDLTGRISEVYTDAEGLDKAYQQGDIFQNNNTLNIAGSHTARDWFDDFTKIRQWKYVPQGFSQIADILNSPEGQYFSEREIYDSQSATKKLTSSWRTTRK